VWFTSARACPTAPSLSRASGAPKSLFLPFPGMPELSPGAEGFSAFPQTAVSPAERLWDISGDAADSLLAQSASPSCSRGSSTAGPPMGARSPRHPNEADDGRSTPWFPRPPRPINKHPAPNHGTSEPLSSSPWGPRGPPSSQPYLGAGVHRRLRGVDDEVAEGEAEPPLRALPQHHRLRAHPGEGPLRGCVGVGGCPISPARRRLLGTRRKMSLLGGGGVSSQPPHQHPQSPRLGAEICWKSRSAPRNTLPAPGPMAANSSPHRPPHQHPQRLLAWDLLGEDEWKGNLRKKKKRAGNELCLGVRMGPRRQRGRRRDGGGWGSWGQKIPFR